MARYPDEYLHGGELSIAKQTLHVYMVGCFDSDMCVLSELVYDEVHAHGLLNSSE